jgi:hypothetical protein
MAQKKTRKLRPVEPEHFVVQFSLVSVRGQYFYARFKTRRAALRFVDFDDHDVIETACIL